jgi:hypothetical protein
MAIDRKKSWYSDEEEDGNTDTDINSPLSSPNKLPNKGKLSSLVGGGQNREILQSGDQNAKLVEYIEKVEPMIKSINTLYNQFAAGVEHRPPLEKLAQLEHIMKILNQLPKVTPAYRFRYQSVLTLYSSYKSRWNKLMQDIESGKIKRWAAPKNRSGSGGR